jgi:hypothetical protein
LTANAVGSEATITGWGDRNYIWLDDDTFVFAYSATDTSTTGSLSIVVGTVSGTSITLGTPYVLATNAGSDDPRMVKVGGSGKFVITYEYQASFYRAQHCSVSGTTISVDSTTTLNTSIWFSSMVYDPDQNAVVLVGRDSANSNYVTAKPITISGTTLSSGTSAVIDAVSTTEASIVYDTVNNKHIIFYRDSSASDIKAVVGTLSSGTITFGTATQVHSSIIFNLCATIDGSGKPVYAAAASNVLYSGVGTVSGTSISFGTQFTQSLGTSTSLRSLNYSSLSGKLVILFEEVADDQIISREGEVSGTDVSFDSNTDYTVITYDQSGLATRSGGGGEQELSGSNKYLLVTADTTAPRQYTPFIYQKSYTENNADNYIGVADAAYSDGATATIQILGSIDDAQTGLTTGSTYFVADDGSLSTTNNGRKIGRAISATEILIDTAMSGPEMNAYLGGLV